MLALRTDETNTDGQGTSSPGTDAHWISDDGEAIARVAKGLAHPARVKIVSFLLTRPGCIGGDIVDEVGLAQSTVSEHLRILKQADLVIGEIERPRICYSLNPEALAPLRALIEIIETHDGAQSGDACHLSPEPQQTEETNA